MENNEDVAAHGDIDHLLEEHCAQANEACKAVPVRETEPGRRVFVPKPASVSSFTDSLVDSLLDVLVGANVWRPYTYLRICKEGGGGEGIVSRHVVTLREDTCLRGR